jgi:hypothetical protein
MSITGQLSNLFSHIIIPSFWHHLTNDCLFSSNCAILFSGLVVLITRDERIYFMELYLPYIQCFQFHALGQIRLIPLFLWRKIFVSVAYKTS